jgi:hypothetical protein
MLHEINPARLECEDRDSGVNGELDYTISEGNIPPVFDINSRTGEYYHSVVLTGQFLP